MNTIWNQGEIVLLDFDPAAGHEPKKRRPALIVSTDRFNNLMSSLTVVCPITSTNNGHPLHIEVGNTASVYGFICVEQLRSVDLIKRNACKTEDVLSPQTMSRVLEAIGAIFGI